MFNWFKENDYDTQREAILMHLERGKAITQLEATKNYSILRLIAIIHSLRKEGYDITTKRKACRKKGTYAEYSLN